MMYSYRIEQAIKAASVLHKDMVSGRKAFPYVSHLFSVACIVADYTDDEDTIIAALLHDTIEYTEYTVSELEEDFGRRVGAIVGEITRPRPEETHGDWKEKHTRYTAQLKHMSDEALMVVAADNIHHMRSMIEEYYGDHVRFQKDFGDAQDERLTIYQSIGNILNRRLTNRIVHEFNHVFDEYKKFTYAAKRKTD